MAVFSWARRKSMHFGEVWVPVIEMALADANGVFCPIHLPIDSGAVVSLLKRSVAQMLGIKLTEGRRIHLGSVGAGPIYAYVHDACARFADVPSFTAPFAFADQDNVPNLLGRLGLFDRFEFVFDPLAHGTRITNAGIIQDASL